MLLFTLSLFTLLLLPLASSFFTAPVPSFGTNVNQRNLTCLFQVSTLYNGTTTYDSGPTNIFGANPFQPYISNVYLCVIIITTTRGPYNLLQTVTNWFFISFWNYYRNTAIHQCNFSSSIDIGYGNCTPRVWETAISQQLCICSTNNCTASFSTCMSSVDATLSSPPPQLPVLQPNLTNTITCYDASAEYDIAINRTPFYVGCEETFYTLGGADEYKCSNYTTNHTVLCSVWYDPVQSNYNQFALIEGDYEESMNTVIDYASDGWLVYESTTSVLVVLHTSYPYNWAICLCMTNNCNQDITTCTNGINFNHSLLIYNGTSPWNSTNVTSSTAASIILSTLTSSSTAAASTSATLTSSSTAAASTSATLTSSSTPAASTSATAVTHPTHSSLYSTSVTSTPSSQLNINSSMHSSSSFGCYSTSWITTFIATVVVLLFV